MDIDKTIVIDQAGMSEPDFGRCSVCGNRLSPVADNKDMYRCTVCGFAQKPKVVIAPGNIVGGKYRVLNYLSGGGGGDIFFCHPLDNMQIRYVLKVLRESDAVSRRRFQREAEILAAIKDEDRIAKIYVEIGDFVKKGQVLAEMDMIQLQQVEQQQ